MIPTSGHTGRVVVVDFHRLKWRSVDVTWLEQAETRRRQSEKNSRKKPRANYLLGKQRTVTSVDNLLNALGL